MVIFFFVFFFGSNVNQNQKRTKKSKIATNFLVINKKN